MRREGRKYRRAFFSAKIEVGKNILNDGFSEIKSERYEINFYIMQPSRQYTIFFLDASIYFTTIVARSEIEKETEIL